MEMRPDPNNPAQPEIKKTSVHKKTRNPIFNDTFQWSIRSKTIDLETVRLHIACYDQQGTSLSGSLSIILTVLSWICVGIRRRRALPSPVCA